VTRAQRSGAAGWRRLGSEFRIGAGFSAHLRSNCILLLGNCGALVHVENRMSLVKELYAYLRIFVDASWSFPRRFFWQKLLDQIVGGKTPFTLTNPVPNPFMERSATGRCRIRSRRPGRRRGRLQPEHVEAPRSRGAGRRGIPQRCAKRSPRYDSSAPSPRSLTTIDWAFVRGQMQVDKARVHGSIKASDHCPISLSVSPYEDEV